jgi:hypothetical protein
MGTRDTRTPNVIKLRVDFILNTSSLSQINSHSFGFNEHFQIMGNITRSWPQGLVLFLQQKRTKMPPLRLML